MIVNTFYADTVPEAISHLYMSMTQWLATFKTGIMHWQRDNIRQLLRIHTDIVQDGKRYANIHDRIARINTRVHMWLTTLYGLGWGCFFVQVMCSRAEEGIWSSTTHLRYAFARISQVYLAVVVYQGMCNLLSAIWCGMQDSFYVALMNTACGHVAELKQQFQQLGTEYGDGENRDGRFYKDLMNCCKHYEKCLR